MTTFFDWLQATGVATTVRESLLLTGALSAAHLLGFTVVTGGAFVSNLRMLGVLLRDHAVTTVTRPARRGVAAGLLISAVTGALLFAPRAAEASINTTFQIKMLLVALAATFQFTIHRRVSANPSATPAALRIVGAIGFLLWTGVALAGAAYILLE